MPVHRLVFHELLPVDEDQHAVGILAADGYALKALPAGIPDFHARHVLQKLADGPGGRTLDVSLVMTETLMGTSCNSFSTLVAVTYTSSALTGSSTA